MRAGPNTEAVHAIEQVAQQATQPDILRWWQIFADQNLESLIAQADANNGT
jgi:outer membrane protein TolC